ncbi:MAG: response regulator [Gammaproteobacteria bacterium]|nr:response regulator [Gammaproteobacteria bacterium]MBU1506506.1 response regulator [Gammaproteobacteria bacterium]MBU2119059.1 response regulator [Gammaproteobacteria bacterium]MBU2171833.1 response regulator [Gammaproteobacteria bacterium]MBU2201249.1 response regulator [Gammaproteobacteria bacterium]
MQPAKTTVLLAEGAGAMRQALASQLESVGFGQVLQAKDGLRALQILRSEPVQVVVADMDMQVHNGLEVLEAMRAEPRLASVPFILMSGGLDRSSAAKAIQLGINDLLVKPFTVRRLIERMQRVLTRDTAQPIAPDDGNPDRATLLVVDDTPDNLQLMAGLFRDRFKVKVAQSGEKALSICQSDAPPDVILLDMMMPGMDGFEVARRLREHHSSECTPIIFVTAVTDEAARHKGLSLGAIDYVFKPIDPDLLRLRVSNLMVYVEHRKQLQKDFDLLRENAQLRSEVQQLRADLLRIQGTTTAA